MATPAIHAHSSGMTAKHLSPSETSPGPLLPRQPNARQRILVVEDDPFIRRLNTEVLACSGYQVDAAENGAAAWMAIQQENYDLIVTDNNMPKMTGIELLQSLHEARQILPVIMATGTIPEAELERRPWLEIQAIMLKPYSYDELLATVKNVLSVASRDSGKFTPPPNWQAQPLPGRPTM
jgi:DNA-binding response OmpR family regulator